MTQEEKIQYITIAANICKFGFTQHQMDLLISLYDLVMEKEGDTDLRSIAQTEALVNQRTEARRIAQEQSKQHEETRSEANKEL